MIYNLDDPADKQRLTETLIKRTPDEARLAFALQLPDRDSRIAYVRNIRSRHGPEAAQRVVKLLQGAR